MIWNFVNSMPQVYRGSPLVFTNKWFGNCQNCHFNRSVTITGITVSGKACYGILFKCQTIEANCNTETQIEMRDGTVEHFPGWHWCAPAGSAAPRCRTCGRIWGRRTARRNWGREGGAWAPRRSGAPAGRFNHEVMKSAHHLVARWNYKTFSRKWKNWYNGYDIWYLHNISHHGISHSLPKVNECTSKNNLMTCYSSLRASAVARGNFKNISQRFCLRAHSPSTVNEVCCEVTLWVLRHI